MEGHESSSARERERQAREGTCLEVEERFLQARHDELSLREGIGVGIRWFRGCRCMMMFVVLKVG